MRVSSTTEFNHPVFSLAVSLDCSICSNFFSVILIYGNKIKNFIQFFVASCIKELSCSETCKILSGRGVRGRIHLCKGNGCIADGSYGYSPWSYAFQGQRTEEERQDGYILTTGNWWWRQMWYLHDTQHSGNDKL